MTRLSTSVFPARRFASTARSGAVLTLFTAAMLAATACGGPSEDPDTYVVKFALGSTPEPLATLEFRVDYDGGQISGNGGLAACELLATANGQTVELSDDDDGELDVEIDATGKPLTAQAEILECDFVASTQPTSGNFRLTTLAATDADDDPIEDLDGIDVVVISTDPVASAAAVAGTSE